MISNRCYFYGTLKPPKYAKRFWAILCRTASFSARLSGFQVRRVCGGFLSDVDRGGARCNRRRGGHDCDQLSGSGQVDRFEGADYQRVEVSAICADGPRQVQIYQPAPHLKAAELWDFQRWYETDLDNFLAQDFNSDGVRLPEVLHIYWRFISSHRLPASGCFRGKKYFSRVVKVYNFMELSFASVLAALSIQTDNMAVFWLKGWLCIQRCGL